MNQPVNPPTVTGEQLREAREWILAWIRANSCYTEFDARDGTNVFPLLWIEAAATYAEHVKGPSLERLFVPDSVALSVDRVVRKLREKCSPDGGPGSLSPGERQLMISCFVYLTELNNST